MCSSQVGKTEILLNVVGYYASQDPSPMLLLQPTLEMAETFSKDRLAPMLRDSPILRGLVSDPRSRDGDNTLLHKRFPGGHITLAGANSPASLASRPIRIVLADEVDRFPVSAGTEGDPVSLARKRASTFWNRKIALVSSPTVKGASRIEQAFSQSDRRRYMVPCLHCETEHVLRWELVRWDDGDPDSAHLVCPECGGITQDVQRVEMILRGRWEASATSRGIAGFHLNELYSPWRRLAEIVADFLAAKPYPETLRAWINTALGETWEEQGEGTRADDLAARAEPYPLWSVPDGGLLLTAGIDVQHDRLAVGLFAWGPDEECWVIGWDELFGSPAGAEVWGQLDEMLARRFDHESGGQIAVAAAAVDAGDGQTTSYVLDYARARRGKVLAIKGQSQAGKPPLGRPTKVDLNLRGVQIKCGATLWPVGSDTIKGVLTGRLKMADPPMVHFSAELPADFYSQISAERLVTKYIKGFPRMEWVKARGDRNEALDCMVYGYAAAVFAGLKRTNWALLRQRIEAKKPAEKPAEPAPAATPPAAPQRNEVWNRKPRGFATKW
jgi:phage terminase large subunit GpA-like protein